MPGRQQFGARLGGISRRSFIGRVVAAAGTYSLCGRYLEASGSPGIASPQQNSGNVSGTAGAASLVESADILYPAEGATLLGYLSRPRNADAQSRFPGLILIHDSPGLDAPIRGFAGRFAAEGFLVLAPDHLSRQGGISSFPTADDAREAIGKIREEHVVQDLEAACSYLRSHASVAGEHIGVIGFGWGGRQALSYAAFNPTLKSAVVFSSAPPREERLASLQAPILVRGALSEDDAAAQAWEDAIAFLKKHLAPEQALILEQFPVLKACQRKVEMSGFLQSRSVLFHG